MPTHKTTEKECRDRIPEGFVCEGCGGNLEPIETVDNSGDPTFWQGCQTCQCFRGGIEKKYFDISDKLVRSRDFRPYAHLDFEDSEDYYRSQNAGGSRLVKMIDRELTGYND